MRGDATRPGPGVMEIAKDDPDLDVADSARAWRNA